ncbi:hypothetical protein HWV07_07160 [Natronomonas salina]|uniref:DUF7344 domain-containing protein n=1 Tax=Natronomonas salina TaxID=1710540 RepID=UPI0015B6AE49|nr:hypothetical protein [Natronomonas salina]QLD88824.1 hypothetical protein HWV07_07160 [Natronomonas salina]
MHIQVYPRSSAIDEPSTDIALDVLADEYRRLAVEALFGRDGPIQIADLAAAVAEGIHDGTPEDSEREIATALHHVHLPKLADADLLDYDAESTTVTSVRTAPLRKYFDVEN